MKYSPGKYVFWCIWAVVILFFGTTAFFGVVYAAIGPLAGGLLILAALMMLQYPFMRLVLGKNLWNGKKAQGARVIQVNLVSTFHTAEFAVNDQPFAKSSSENNSLPTGEARFVQVSPGVFTDSVIDKLHAEEMDRLFPHSPLSPNSSAPVPNPPKQ